MTRLLALSLVALTLQGCILEKLDNPSEPSPSQQAWLDQQAMFSASPVVEPVAFVSVPAKQCVERFRENRCDEQGNEVEWYY
jgi:heme/copper-type cytochrome/quinol oxidase subunit 2